MLRPSTSLLLLPLLLLGVLTDPSLLSVPLYADDSPARGKHEGSCRPGDRHKALYQVVLLSDGTMIRVRGQSDRLVQRANPEGYQLETLDGDTVPIPLNRLIGLRPMCAWDEDISHYAIGEVMLAISAILPADIYLDPGILVGAPHDPRRQADLEFFTTEGRLVRKGTRHIRVPIMAQHPGDLGLVGAGGIHELKQPVLYVDGVVNEQPTRLPK